ncbi:MAG: chemotaxis protein CheW [Methylophaga sp.]|nr:chemotaxis protein CheW [Methylophaga sp.]
MAHLHHPADIIALLQDIERRSRQRVAGLSQQDNLQDAWTGIGFRLADMHFLIPLDHSREVFPVPTQITSVPKSQRWIFGVANLRGDLLPIIDLQLYLQGRDAKIDKRSRVMVINHPDVYSGLLVDEVYGLKHFQRPPEPEQASLHLNLRPYLQGIVSKPDRQWYVLDFHKLADDPKFINAAA